MVPADVAGPVAAVVPGGVAAAAVFVGVPAVPAVVEPEA